MSEIDAASSAGKISRLATFQEVSEHLPYYIAIIKESMRLTPSVPNLFPRLVSKGGMVLDGMVVPEGTEVSCNPWVLHREKKYYGEDAEVFRPERWLEAGRTGGTKDLEKFNMTFGYGARSCLGKDIAYMELFKAPLQVRDALLSFLETLEQGTGSMLTTIIAVPPYLRRGIRGRGRERQIRR